MKDLKRFLSIMLFMCANYACFAQEKSLEEIWRETDSKRTSEIHYRDTYAASNGIVNWYPIGFVRFDEYDLFEDKKHHQFLLTDYDKKKKLSSKNILKRQDVFVVLDINFLDYWVFNYMTFYEFYQFQKLVPDDCVSDERFGQEQYYEKNGDLIHFSFSPKSAGFLLILMTGTAYNNMTYKEIIDGKIPPIKFPDTNAYYKVLVPIWAMSDAPESEDAE